MICLPMLIDIACNITSDQFKENEINSIILRSKEYNTMPIFVGVDYKSSLKCIEQSIKYNTFCYVGVHPTHANLEDVKNIRSLLKDSNRQQILCIGECGLDYARLSFSEKHLQKNVFRAQLEMEGERYFLHSRDAHRDFMEMTSEYKIKGVVHSFTGSVEESQELLRRGFYIGINGCSVKNEIGISVIEELPLDRILIETDSPYCKIRKSYFGHKFIKSDFKELKILKKRNEPCCVKQMVEIVSIIKNRSYKEVEETILNNSINFFGDQIREIIKSWK